MKYKISISSIAMAAIMLVSMVAAAGVSAAQPATVGAPITGGPSVCYDGVNTWYVAQGAATTGGNIYYKIGATGTWKAIGSGTNPTVVCQGGAGDIAIFVRGNDGDLYEKMTTNGGATWSSWYALPGTVAAGTGPDAVYIERAIPFLQPSGPISSCTPGSQLGPSIPCGLPGLTFPPISTVTLQTDVFYVNSGNNHLMWDSQVYGIVTQTDLGGVVTATPGAVINSTGYPIVFVRGSQGSLYYKTDSSGGFGGWNKFSNGVLAAGTGPAAVRDSVSGNVYVFVAGTDTHLYEANSTNDSLTWSSWLNLGGFLTSSPSAAYATTHVAVMVRGRDGGIWTDTGTAPYTATSDWSWSTTSIAGP